jgi:hypothetical protein
MDSERTGAHRRRSFPRCCGEASRWMPMCTGRLGSRGIDVARGAAHKGRRYGGVRVGGHRYPPNHPAEVGRRASPRVATRLCIREARRPIRRTPAGRDEWNGAGAFPSIALAWAANTCHRCARSTYPVGRRPAWRPARRPRGNAAKARQSCQVRRAERHSGRSLRPYLHMSRITAEGIHATSSNAKS